MNTTHVTQRHVGSLRVSEWVLAILGGIAAFLGLFILFGGEDQYIGIGGDVSWRVADIAPGWGYGLLVGGIASLIVAGLLLRRDRHGGYVHERTSEGDLVVHAVVFVLVNAFLWVQDIVIGDGLNYAYWVTILWGIGLVGHAYSVFSERSHRTPSG